MTKRSYAQSNFSSFKKAKVMPKSFRRPPPSVKPEKKSHNITIDQTLFGGSTTSGYRIINLSVIGSGTDINQRIGRAVTTNSLQLLLDFELGATTVEWDNGFWAVIQDRRPNGITLPGFGDMFTSSTSYGNAVFNNNLHPGRFTELARGEFTVDIAKQYAHRIRKSIPLKNRTTSWRSTTASDMESNAYYLVVACTDLTTTSLTSTKVKGISQIHFYDT